MEKDKKPAKKTSVKKPKKSAEKKPKIKAENHSDGSLDASAVKPIVDEIKSAVASETKITKPAAKISKTAKLPENAEAKSQPEQNSSVEDEKNERYWEAVGRRKKAIARVRIYTRGEKMMLINHKPYGEYFHTKEQQRTAEESLQKMKSVNRFRVSALVKGGGLNAQAEAVRHGIARALVEFNADFRKRLRRAGFLTRDPRMKERKKFGLKSARRRPQWAKR